MSPRRDQARVLLSGLTRHSWWRVLAVGAVAWLMGVAAVAWTQDPILLPGVFLVGSFLVPFSVLVALLEHVTRLWLDRSGETALVPYRLLLGFAAGGALGVWPAAVLEHVLIGWFPDAFFPSVAVAEETVKLALVALLGLGLARYLRRDGMLLGAAVGLGFSAFESFGYAYDTAGSLATMDIAVVMETQVTRGLLSPVGHGLWTGLAGGALFAAATAAGRLRVTGSVLAWLGVAVVLHLGWDVSAGLAAVVVAAWTSTPVDLAEFRSGTVPGVTGVAVAALGILRTTLLAVNAALGMWLFRSQWRRQVAP